MQMIRVLVQCFPSNVSVLEISTNVAKYDILDVNALRYIVCGMQKGTRVIILTPQLFIACFVCYAVCGGRIEFSAVPCFCPYRS